MVMKGGPTYLNQDNFSTLTRGFLLNDHAQDKVSFIYGGLFTFSGARSIYASVTNPFAAVISVLSSKQIDDFWAREIT